MFRFPTKLVAIASASIFFLCGCQMQIITDPTTTRGTTAETPAVTVPTTTTVATPGVTTTAPTPETGEPADTTPAATTTTKAPTTTTKAPVVTTQPPVTTTTKVPSTTTTWPTPEDKPNPENKKRVAFTFDDGPHSTLTYKFVDKLKEYNASATFFVVGNRLGASGGAAIQYAYENGCEIGLHSYTHEWYYSKCTDEAYFEDLQKTAAAINKYIPATVTLMRPPGGNITADRVASCPYGVIMWSVDSEDWRYKGRGDEATKQANINTIVNNIMKQIGDGDIVLMHELYENSYEAFCIVIERLYAEGYEVVSVSELLGSDLQAGKKYYSK